MQRLLLTLCVFWLGCLPAYAAVSVDVSSDVINVTTGFNGASLTVFGTQEQPGALVIVVEGPPKTIVVKKKSPVLGLWTNTDSRRYVNMPAFYETAASVPLDEAAPPELLRANRIGLTGLMSAPAIDDGTAAFSNALVRIQQENQLYGRDVKAITYVTPMLYKVVFDLPAIVSPGHYKVSALLFRDGALIEQASTPFEVVPVGLSAELRHFATDFGLLYGLIGVFMALIAGWLATVLLKRE